MTDIKIGKNLISKDSRPYIIAEIGSNFDQDLNKAFKLIEKAAESGANAVKFQLFKADELYKKTDALYSVFKSIELNPDWLPRLKDFSEELNLDFLASAFDLKSLEILESLNVVAHKIASSETTNLKFLRKCAVTGKPLIISTGMCDMVDIEEAVNICRSANNEQIILMQCGSIYPLEPKDANLNVIHSLINRFKYPVGLSDHTLDNIASITAIGLGARVFEKHITMDKMSEGPDHFYAIEPKELDKYIHDINQAFMSLGSHQKSLLSLEKEIGRREGLYITRDISSGDTISADDIESKRPALGIRSRYKNSIIGSNIQRDLKKGSPIYWEDLN